MRSSVRWRRLDLPGRDEAHLDPTPDGYLLAGAARFQDQDGPVDLSYVVGIESDWATRFATVDGSTAAGPFRIDVRSGADRTWTFNGVPVPSVTGCLDFDLGFTPATNLPSIRRMNLAVGKQAEVTVAWLPSLPAGTLEPLRQVYHRIEQDRYRYSCPDIPFDSILTLDAAGFVRDYPPLWEHT